MQLVRMARSDDIDAVLALASAGGSGLTNLPPDRDALAVKLAASERAVGSAEARETGAAIFLIVEHDGAVAGTSCVFPRVGAEWPFYSYRLTRQSHRSVALGRTKAQVLLNIANDFDGEAEVGGLFIDPNLRGHALGSIAARARYLLMAAHRDWFGRRVIAELRGWQDGQGQSPVWNAIGAHFYDMEFHEADRTGALAGNQFIADLGPRYPLYVSMLPEAVQVALDKPHNDGRYALEMLLAEGFTRGDYVDIFDGGPTVVADIDAVRTVRDAAQAICTGIGPGEQDVLAATGSGASFRVARGMVDAAGTVSPELAQALSLGLGDPYLWVGA